MPKASLTIACALLLGACMMPPPASEKATDAARELNIAARFGRIDIAAGRAASEERSEFIRRRAMWGGEIRVVDVELAGLTMPDSDHAVFQVDYSWMRLNEDTFTLQLRDASGKLHSFRNMDLHEIKKLHGESPMPSYQNLSPEALQDLIAYLASRK